MAVVTVNGQIGCGGFEVGAQVALVLNADYVDRLILVEAAKRIGATVEVMAEKEQRLGRVRDRIARFLQGHVGRILVFMVANYETHGQGRYGVSHTTLPHVTSI